MSEYFPVNSTKTEVISHELQSQLEDGIDPYGYEQVYTAMLAADGAPERMKFKVAGGASSDLLFIPQNMVTILYYF